MFNLAKEVDIASTSTHLQPHTATKRISKTFILVCWIFCTLLIACFVSAYLVNQGFFVSGISIMLVLKLPFVFMAWGLTLFWRYHRVLKGYKKGTGKAFWLESAVFNLVCFLLLLVGSALLELVLRFLWPVTLWCLLGTVLSFKARNLSSRLHSA